MMDENICLVAWGVTITPTELKNGKYAWVVCGNIDGGDIMDEDGDIVDFSLNYEGDSPEELVEVE
jgi:hypothetical protein